MQETIYAIGDIHGQLGDLIRIHAWIEADRQRNSRTNSRIKIVHVGDLIDRGPDSAGVIDYLLRGQQAGKPWVVLKGNHDRFLQKILEEPTWRDARLRPDYTWLHPNMGGLATLASYGLHDIAARPFEAIADMATRAVPAAHLAFLRALPLYYQVAGLVFVHAGIKPGIAMEDQAEDDLLWTRKPEFTEFTGDFGFLLVHGHTMVERVTHFGPRIDIDTGAGRGAPISAIGINGADIWQVGEDSRLPVYRKRP